MGDPFLPVINFSQFKGFIVGMLLTVSFFLGYIHTGGGGKSCDPALDSLSQSGGDFNKSLTVEQKRKLASVCPKVVRGPNGMPWPVLPPPDYEASVPDILESGRDGTVNLSWKKVESAKEYLITIKDNQGQPVKIIKTPENSYTVSDLNNNLKDPTLEYKLSIASVNQNDIPGASSHPRPLVVRKGSNVMAPTIKIIRTEE